MSRSWILFAHESTGKHWFYMEGEDLEAVSQNTQFPVEMPPFREEEIDPHLVSKKRIIIINKTRYVVVARGTSYEP